MNYSKFIFNKKKKNTIRKKQYRCQLKEIKFRPTTDEYDCNIKIKKIISLLKKKNKIKINIMFKGREIMFQNLGIALIKKIKELLKDYASIEKNLKIEGKKMFIIFAPI